MDELWGRKVLENEVNHLAIDLERVILLPTMEILSDSKIRCLRCGESHLKRQVQLPTSDYYCPKCIQLGRVDTGACFYHVAEPSPQKRTIRFQWEGSLTEGQETISTKIIESIQKQKSRLVWAVTGAGKTEMLFKGIRYALEQGYRVGIASPRVDVCLELFPRIQRVLPKEKITLLHGKIEERYHYTPLVICTTHQLLRFYRAFDVLIIDEVDAFPFVNNHMLHYGVKQALKKQHTCIYLTATPTKELKQKINSKQLAVSMLPARYHRRKLPVPKVFWCSKSYIKLKNGQCPKIIKTKLKQLLVKTNILIFCPIISLMADVEKSIKVFMPEVKITCVHSADPERLEKVKEMRENKYQILISSTILERGVTFARLSVLVIGANHPVFTEAALVQIAGRVDRGKEKSGGEICFFHDGQSLAIKKAIRQIESMNRMAMKRRMIDDL